MKLYLIGMPGSGKTTIGQELAEKLLLPFIDLDREIEQKERMSIAEIFSTKGEDYFRRIESETLNAFAAGSNDFILATGGGAPCFYDGIIRMNATGLTIFLDVPIEDLIQRTKRSDRPLLKSDNERELRNRLTELARKRMSVYRKASIIVTHPTAESVLNRLLPFKK